MKILVKIEVRKAEPHAGGWSVSYGPDTFTHSQNYLCDSYDALSEYVQTVAKQLAFDSRLSKWPGLEVAASPATTRKPNGWDDNRRKAVARVQIVGGVSMFPA